MTGQSNGTFNVHLQTKSSDAKMAALRRAAPAATIRFFSDRQSLENGIAEADVVGGDISAGALGAAKRLKWIHSWAAGPDSMLYPEMRSSEVPFTCSKGNGAIPLAEHAMMLMLMLNRNATRWIDAQRGNKWDRFTHGELAGKVCGILGLGHSGADLAQKAKAFHMEVKGLRRHPMPMEHVDRMYGPGDLYAFLTGCDFIVVAAPRTDETLGLLDAAAFRTMKPSAFLVCFSRGGIIVDDDLLDALNKGEIAGAGLDAHGVEPLPKNSPFWQAPNTIVTPHNGATTEETFARGFDIFVDNLRRFAAGRPLVNLVDKSLGY